MIKFIVWDVDGTLYTSKKISNILYKKYQKDLSSFWGIPFKKLEKIINQKKIFYKSTTLALSSLINVSTSKLTKDIYEKHSLGKYLKKDPKLINLFNKLVKFDHFALRNGTQKRTIETIKKLGLGKIKKPQTEFGPFNKIWGTIDLAGITKPSQIVFDMVRTYLYKKYYWKKSIGILSEKSMKKFSNQILIIGDRPEMDLKPAKNLGFKTALVWADKDPKLSYIDYVFKTVYEVENIFKKNEEKKK